MTRYVMEIDLGECADAGEADRAGRTIANAIEYGWFAKGHTVRPALPVIRTCGDCRWIKPQSHDIGTVCSHHAHYPYRVVEEHEAPPEWCPKRGETP